jgi:hypothetical protein
MLLCSRLQGTAERGKMLDRIVRTLAARATRQGSVEPLGSPQNADDLATPVGTAVREMTEDDLSGAAEVLVSVFGRWPNVDISLSPADHLRWKVTGPLNEWKYQFVAERDGKVVGTKAEDHVPGEDPR